MARDVSCKTPEKVPHASRGEAQRHLRSLRRKGGSVDLNVYRCGDHWHVGHSLYSLQRRIRRARREGVA